MTTKVRSLFYTGELFFLFISFFCFFYFLVENVATDIQGHAYLVRLINQDQAEYSANFFYYFLVNIFSFFSNSKYVLETISCLLMSGSVVTKYALSKFILQNGIKLEKDNKLLISIFSFLLLFFSAIPDLFTLGTINNWYLGKLVPNVWHNSTTIFLMPFALYTFWHLAIKNFDNEKPTLNWNELFLGGILIILNVIIKPSFLFVFIPIFSVFFLYKYGLKKIYFQKMLPIFIGIFLIIIEYILIYYFKKSGLESKESGIAISSPFEIWSKYISINKIPQSILLSLLFPLYYLLFFFNEFIKDSVLKFASWMYLLGIIISIFIKETGSRMYDGNFFWQNVISLYILILLILRKLLINYFKNKDDFKTLVGLFIFAIHVISGIAYVIKTFYYKNYF